MTAFCCILYAGFLCVKGFIFILVFYFHTPYELTVIVTNPFYRLKDRGWKEINVLGQIIQLTSGRAGIHSTEFAFLSSKPAA